VVVICDGGRGLWGGGAGGCGAGGAGGRELGCLLDLRGVVGCGARGRAG
jgi:hypothetical protein